MNRAAAVLIVAFWLVMTGLLIRLEISPDQSDMLSVPPSHVFKLMFTHEQVSELRIMDRSLPVGSLRLIPKNSADPDGRTLDFSGSLFVRLPDSAKKQRIAWNGILSVDRAFDTRRLQLTLTLREPACRLFIDLDPATKQVRYEIRQGDMPLKNATVSDDEKGVAALLRDELGIDPGALENIRGSVSKPVLTAKQTELKVRSEKIVAYLLTLRQGETTVLEIYVSQLGQILLAKTLPGYTLSAEDMMP